APLLGWLGRRRGWMVLTQILIAIGLAMMSTVGLSAGLVTIGALALLVAFSSSTQDIVVDAWRIEAAADSDELGLLSAAYQFGYRLAVLVTEAAILIIANHFGWRLSYGVMAALMGIGVSASLMATAPLRASIGLVATMAGIAAGCFSALRFGYVRTLIAGVVLKILVIANFATMAYAGPDLRVFGAVIAADNFGIGFAGVALVTYMSSLTSLGYTATQYALLSSAYTYVGKFAKGFSGVAVELLAAGRTLLEASGVFFIADVILG